MRPQRIAIALSALTLTALLGSAPPASASAPYCGITWGSLNKVALQSTTAPITNARTGRHDCFDRLVLDFDGTPASGYDVDYVNAFRPLDGGSVVPVSAGATLRVRAFGPVGAAWATGQHIKSPGQLRSAGYRTFRDLVYGASDGYNTDFGLGVRARLPFRVFTLTGPGSDSRLVIDVAHRW